MFVRRLVKKNQNQRASVRSIKRKHQSAFIEKTNNELIPLLADRGIEIQPLNKTGVCRGLARPFLFSMWKADQENPEAVGGIIKPLPLLAADMINFISTPMAMQNITMIPLIEAVNYLHTYHQPLSGNTLADSLNYLSCDIHFKMDDTKEHVFKKAFNEKEFAKSNVLSLLLNAKGGQLFAVCSPRHELGLYKMKLTPYFEVYDANFSKLVMKCDPTSNDLFNLFNICLNYRKENGLLLSVEAASSIHENNVGQLDCSTIPGKTR